MPCARNSARHKGDSVPLGRRAIHQLPVSIVDVFFANKNITIRLIWSAAMGEDLFHTRPIISSIRFLSSVSNFVPGQRQGALLFASLRLPIVNSSRPLSCSPTPASTEHLTALEPELPLLLCMICILFPPLGPSMKFRETCDRLFSCTPNTECLWSHARILRCSWCCFAADAEVWRESYL